jgi:hypothetical protein
LIRAGAIEPSDGLDGFQRLPLCNCEKTVLQDFQFLFSGEDSAAVDR